ncbi:hypothetical protein [Agrobacterium tumefaciens]|uniref:hypothetical protein n=1 Tax=Agrobacterium tumefaciens TaxID=358 RepID=UPI00157493F8|nr:hypothetical protein [Agrobacterium tumefaciens]NSX90869.1 hypothetical protein [Agrobacterium tumefaciens]
MDFPFWDGCFKPAQREKAAKKTSKKLHFFWKNNVACAFRLYLRPLPGRKSNSLVSPAAGHLEGWQERAGPGFCAEAFSSRRDYPAPEVRRCGSIRRRDFFRLEGSAGRIQANG